MQHKISRRAIIKGGLMAGALVPAMGLIGNTAGAAALTPLDPNDPMAKALKFVTDGSKVNASKNPTYQADTEMRQLLAIPRESRRCGRGLQSVRRPQRSRSRLVQCVGPKGGRLNRRRFRLGARRCCGAPCWVAPHVRRAQGAV